MNAKGKLIRMDNVGIVVKDLKAAISFFTELGMELEGKTTVEGPWVDHTIGLDHAKSDIAMLRTPDGHSRLELSCFQRPKAMEGQIEHMPVNTLGIHRIMFAVSDIREVICRLEKHGAKLIGEVVNYADMYLLCYLRGPEGIIVALAEKISDQSVKEILANS